MLDSASAIELQSLYHDCFAERKNILILENAIDAQQVMALLVRSKTDHLSHAFAARRHVSSFFIIFSCFLGLRFGDQIMVGTAAEW